MLKWAETNVSFESQGVSNIIFIMQNAGNIPGILLVIWLN
jgi:hypothetical protein